MDTAVDWIIDFLKARQINFALAAVLLTCFLVYQNWDQMINKVVDVGTRGSIQNEEEGRKSRSHSRGRSASRSRTRSPSNDHKQSDPRPGRRGRKCYKRCPDCGHCN